MALSFVQGDSLLARAKSRRNEIHQKQIRTLIQRISMQFVLPGAWSPVLHLLAGGLLVAAGYKGFSSLPVIEALSGLPHIHQAWPALLGVHSALAAIPIPMLLFIFELANRDQTPSKAPHEVLITSTCLYPLLTFTLASLVLSVILYAYWPRPYAFLASMTLFAFTVVGVIAAYTITLYLLFSPNTLRRAATRLLKRKISASIENSILKRISDVVLSEELRSMAVGAGIFMDRTSDVYHSVLPTVPGYVVNIKLVDLRKIASRLALLSPAKPSNVLPNPTTDDAAGRSEDRPAIMLRTQYGSYTDTRRNPLAQFRTEFVSAPQIRNIEQSIRLCFEVADDDPLILEQRILELEISHLLNSLVIAIRGGRAGEFRDGLDAIEALLDGILDTLSEYGIVYNSQLAKRERTFPRNSWQELEFLTRLVRTIIEECFRTNSTTILAEMDRFLYSILLRIYDRSDFLIYTEILRWHQHYEYKRSSIRDSERSE